jgi:hypothetical protein
MNPERETPTDICVVCGEQAEAAMTAECNWCNGRFHLNQRNDTEAKDCGQVWVDEQYLALQFACNTCLAGTDRAEAVSAPTSTPPTLRRSPAERQRRYKKRA